MFKIKSDMKHGTKIVIPGEAEGEPDGTPPGDVIFIVKLLVCVKFNISMFSLCRLRYITHKATIHEKRMHADRLVYSIKATKKIPLSMVVLIALLKTMLVCT